MVTCSTPPTPWRRLISSPRNALAALPAHWLVGRYVKLGFPCLDCPDVTEHMWVQVTAVRRDDWLVGVLDNDPQHRVGALCGAIVAFRRDEIEAVMPG